MKIGPRPKYYFKLTISISLVLYLTSKVSWKQVGSALLQSKPDWIALGFIFMIGMLYLQAWRWKILLNIPGLPVSKYLHYIFVGLFYRIIMPGSLSADMLKVVLFGKKYNKPLHESSVVFFSQFLGMMMQWILGLFGLFYFGAPLLKILDKAELSWRKLLVLALVSLVFLVAISFVPAVRRFVVKIMDALLTAVRTPGLLGRLIWVTVGIQILMIASAYCIFRGAGVEIPLLFLCFQMALANLFVALPISISGIGVVDYLNLFLLQNILGTPTPIILAVSVVSYSLLILNALIGGAWILWRNVTSNGQPEAT